MYCGHLQCKARMVSLHTKIFTEDPGGSFNLHINSFRRVDWLPLPNPHPNTHTNAQAYDVLPKLK